MRRLSLLLCLVVFLFASCASSKAPAVVQEDVVEKKSSISVEDGKVILAKEGKSVAVLHLEGGKLNKDLVCFETMLESAEVEVVLSKMEVERNGVVSTSWKKLETKSGEADEYVIVWDIESYPIFYNDIGIVVTKEKEEEPEPVVVVDEPVEEPVVVEEPPKPTNPTSYTILDSFSLLPAERHGYVFLGWIEEGEGADKARPYSIRKGTTGEKNLVAVWAPMTMSLSFSLDGGEFEGEVQTSYDYDSESFQIPSPKKEHYIFEGWYINGSEELTASPYTVDTKSIENLSLVAVWSPDVYAITYDSDGVRYSEPMPEMVEEEFVVVEVEAPVNPSSYTVEDQFTLLPEAKYGYDFCGWILEGEESHLADPEYTVEYGTSGRKDFVAVWSPKVFQIYYYLCGGKMSEAHETYFVFDAPSFTVPQPVRANYTFIGWIDNEDAEPVLDYTVDTTVEGNLKLTALWEPVAYTITYDYDGGAYEGEGNPSIYTTETEDFILSSPSKDGYRFAGWNVEFAEGTYGPEYVLNLSNDGEEMMVEVFSDHAVLTIPDYIPSYLLVDLADDFIETYGESLIGYSAVIEDYSVSVNYPEGEYGAILDYFSNMDLSVASVTVSKGSHGDRRYKAIWDLEVYYLAYDEEGVLVVEETVPEEIPGNPGFYTVLDEFTLINPERKGFVFLGWIEEGEVLSSARETYTVEVGTTGDKSFIPVWKKAEYSISYNLNGGEVYKELPSSYTYDDGVYLIANPERENYEFLGWMDGTSRKPVVNYSINTRLACDLSLEAIWTPVVYSIEYDLSGGRMAEGKYNPSFYTVEDSSFALENPTKAGYSFLGWRNIGTNETPVVNYRVNVSMCKDMALEAVWRPISYSISYVEDGAYYKYDIVNPTSYDVESDDIYIANPYKDGYTFEGWIVSGDRSETLYKNAIIKKGTIGDIKLYAVFKQERFPVGKITEMQLEVIEYGRNNIPRPDWVISLPSDSYGVRYGRAYALEGDFASSYDEAVRKAQMQIASSVTAEVSVINKSMNDTPYISKTVESSEILYETRVLEYWEDSKGGVWVLVVAEV